jgi:hypothetical protein
VNWLRKQRPRTVLGLTLDGGRLEAVVLRRTNGAAVVQKAHAGSLTLDLLHNEAELAGREIRNQLTAAGVRERRCVVGVPLGWAFTVLTRLPDLPEADTESFLQLEAERGFPCPVEDLQIAITQFESPRGERYAMQVGVRRDHLDRLEAVLTAAQLKPESFSLGLAALPGAVPAAARGAITACVGESSVDVLAGCGGVVALRALGDAFDAEGGTRRVQADVVARELRITLGQLPEDFRTAIRELNVLGDGHFAQELAVGIRPRAEALGLAVHHLSTCSGSHHGLELADGAAVSPALSLAAQFVAGRGTDFEFLPPKPTVWEKFSARYSSRRLVWAGATAGATVLVASGMFAFQQAQLGRLRSEWAVMRPKVAELEDLQTRIRKYRSWSEESLASLGALRRVTEAFPAEGTVTAKTFEIRGGTVVSVTGVARDNPLLLRTLDQLRAAPEVANVKVEQIRGKTPMQFTFDFSWTGGPGR